MWDKRYQQAEYVYGTEPNDFLASLPLAAKAGQRLLSLAEGEGRNAVYLAKLGFDVLAVDQSIIGLNKALKLARERQTVIKVEQANLEKYQIAAHTYDGVISIFGHFSAEVRRRVHVQAVGGLKKGGFFVLEAYSKEQLSYNTGGPTSLEMLYNLEDLEDDLSGLKFVIKRKIQREVNEGTFHTGTGSVIQIYGIKD